MVVYFLDIRKLDKESRNPEKLQNLVKLEKAIHHRPVSQHHIRKLIILFMNLDDLGPKLCKKL